jgi:hypothetical protein
MYRLNNHPSESKHCPDVQENKSFAIRPIKDEKLHILGHHC